MRQLRRESTDAEKAMWRLLQTKQFDGWKFRRQHPVGRFVADFACPATKRIVELDGGHHAVRVNEGAQRTKHLERLGWRVIRFWNTEVLTNLDGALETILVQLSERTPSLPRSGGEGDGGRG